MSNVKTIGIDIRPIGKKRTGDEVFFLNVTVALTRLDQKNKYLLFTDVAGKEGLQSIAKLLGIGEKSNFSIVSLGACGKFKWNLLCLPRYLRRNKVDVYLMQYIVPWFIPSRTKIITVIHDISFNFFPRFIKIGDLIFLKTLIPLSIRLADKVLGVSRFTRDEIARYYKTSAEKTDYVYNAVAPRFFSAVTEKQREAIRKKYFLPEKFFLYVGTMQPRKNLPFLLEAFAGIREKLPDWKLVLAGNRQGRNFDEGIDATLKKLGLAEKVIFPGFVDEEDKPALFSAAGVFVFPSLYEGFGIPLLEAMATGTPVATSDLAVSREVAGEAALFFNPSDLANCREKLYSGAIDEKLRKEMRRKGLARSREFSWEKTADKLLGIIEKV